MTEPLNRIVLPADGQRTFEELREEFRAANRDRIRATLREDVLTFRDKDGFFLRHADGTLVKKKSGYLTDAPIDHPWHQRVDEWRKAGGVVPEFTDEFKIIEGSGLDRELSDLARDAEAMSRHEGVIYPNDNPEGETNADQLRGGGDDTARDPGTTT